MTIKCLNGTTTTLDADMVRQNLSGVLLTPESPGYEEARSIWNAMIGKKPALIVRCQNTQDVCAAVNFARKNDLLLAVRGGGHNIAGKAQGRITSKDNEEHPSFAPFGSTRRPSPQSSSDAPTCAF